MSPCSLTLSSSSSTNINSQCGTCYGITYNGKTIYVLAIDYTSDGFNIAESAMNELTNGQAALGRIDAQYAQVGVNMCGL